METIDQSIGEFSNEFGKILKIIKCHVIVIWPTKFSVSR